MRPGVRVDAGLGVGCGRAARLDDRSPRFAYKLALASYRNGAVDAANTVAVAVAGQWPPDEAGP